jgi:hypothetical protein
LWPINDQSARLWGPPPSWPLRDSWGTSLNLFDDAARIFRAAPERPPAVPKPLPHLPEGLPAAVKDGVSTFRQMRNGTPEEKVMANAACAVFNQTATGTRRQEELEEEIRRNLPLDVPSTVVDRYVGKLANAMYAAEVDGGLAKWYVQYCM